VLWARLVRLVLELLRLVRVLLVPVRWERALQGQRVRLAPERLVLVQRVPLRGPVC
jgi:hypothetical protein